MKQIEQLEAIIEQLRREALQDEKYSCVAIRADTVNRIFREQTGHEPTITKNCCRALRAQFREGKDFFRRGKDRDEWQKEIPDGQETTTFEVLFEIRR
ncbi:hypothetical protein [Amylibacter sp. IMCC11727]|uniref:hypothetical protein n=1 Tax=Amylibacter sp. IMCC11727 TaxID=3039851 RepID=UPI00244E0796|nr:hypothetical protein [Amylibacter sp. IMCC11727]WGI21526.1 hypothetical protein QBD29_15635 [Amylibacter sp. IMCC11727]